MRRPTVWLVLVLAVALAATLPRAVRALDQEDPPPPAKPGVGCAHRPPRETCAVLFAGNSLTFVNDLPRTFARLAESGGRSVWAQTVAAGGETLQQHVEREDVVGPLRQRTFNVVVLQEQTAHAALDDLRAASTLPAARTLVAAIRAEPAQPLLFASWAWTYGVPERGLDGDAMQAAIAAGYRELSETLDVPLAPVGAAWLAAGAEDDAPPLWQEDGNHPTDAGTYLAACVFYATIFGADPRGLSYTDGLPKDTAARLQAIAAHTRGQTP